MAQPGHIRNARPDDAPRLPDVERSAGAIFRALPELAWIADDDVQSVARHLEQIAAGTSWVATDAQDHPIGFLGAERSGDTLHIWELAVTREHQHRGLGRALLMQAMKAARSAGMAAMTLTTFRDLPWNAPFYAKLGFRPLTEDNLSKRLRDILAAEAAHGLPGDRRCAMILNFE